MTARSARTEPRTEGLSYRGLTQLGVGIGTLIAIAVGAIALFNAEPPRLESDLLGALPFVALIAMPAVLAAIGIRRPPTLLAAGILSLPTAFLSFAGVTLPLLIPATLYLVAYGRAPRSRARVPVSLISLMVVVLAVGAMAITLTVRYTVCTETVTYSDGRTVTKTTTDEGGGSIRGGGGADPDGDVTEIRSGCSEETRPAAGAAALGLLVLGAAAATWMSKRRDEHDL